MPVSYNFVGDNLCCGCRLLGLRFIENCIFISQLHHNVQHLAVAINHKSSASLQKLNTNSLFGKFKSSLLHLRYMRDCWFSIRKNHIAFRSFHYTDFSFQPRIIFSFHHCDILYLTRKGFRELIANYTYCISSKYFNFSCVFLMKIV